MDFTLALDANVTLAETPIWDKRVSRLYWTDLFSGDVHAFNPDTGTDTLYKTDGGMIGSAIPCSDPGRLLCALERGICLLNLKDGSLTPVADPNNGNPKNRYNDTRVDARGRIFASTVSKLYGTADYTPDQLGSFYMVDTDGSVKTVADGINQYNCIVWNGDSTKMFVIDTYNGKLLVFNYDIDHGPAGGVAQEIDMNDIGMPDGISVDMADNLYICHWTGRISVWDKNLELKELIDFPVPQVCCGGFGGNMMRDFYVATAKYAYTPEQLADRQGAGGLFCARFDIEGRGDHFYPVD